MNCENIKRSPSPMAGALGHKDKSPLLCYKRPFILSNIDQDYLKHSAEILFYGMSGNSSAMLRNLLT